MSLRRLIALCSFALLGTAKAPGGEADFLVVEKVAGLRIYNKYQQEASAKERQAIEPLAPMRILNSHELLADGFTHCMRVEVDGQIFYLLKDNEGRLSGSALSGFEKTFANAAVIADTVRILTDRTFRFSPINSSARQLSRDERLLRIFRHHSRTYCRTLDPHPTHGWVDFAGTQEKRDWELVQHSLLSNTALPASLVQRIQFRLEETNGILARLFTFFNKQTHQQKEAPRWTIETSAHALFCTLENTPTDGDFEQSTFYLVNAIENIVMGSGYAVRHSPGRIEIQPNR